jgi:hypothetical protein
MWPFKKRPTIVALRPVPTARIRSPEESAEFLAMLQRQAREYEARHRTITANFHEQALREQAEPDFDADASPLNPFGTLAENIAMLTTRPWESFERKAAEQAAQDALEDQK